MKRIFVFFFVFIILISCKKNNNTEINNIPEEEEYTDSFSPPDWENPVSRKSVQSGDKDIGIFISKDVIEPKSRKTLLLVEKFIEMIKTNNETEIEKILVSSAYHSFILRYPDLKFNKSYILRVEQPADLNQTKFWVQFKVIFPDKSLIGKLEIEFNGEDCKISDFEDGFFKNLKSDNEKEK